ncbi:hypothetical protein P389DRAFT_65529 [Cystobasidium minutum MCA 4210]|uniref:uncharacterized protein n=1 Tax=Cystobasidium minutum MCA 4210 TaxID=1397322 RepID=UPI0034CE177D|eukprot:jgi/Rhomi1/65529/CE65528_71
MPLKTMNDVEQPLLARAATVQPVNKGKLTLTKVRAVLMPKKKYIIAIQMACVLFYVVALFNMHQDRQEHEPVEHAIVRRTVLNGVTCTKQRKQLNTFLASFFGGIFAADHLYARNWQLAVPKLIFFILGAPISLLIGLITGFTGHFAWWLIDVVMWGVGFYTTDTHWGNPTKGCAVKGW